MSYELKELNIIRCSDGTFLVRGGDESGPVMRTAPAFIDLISIIKQELAKKVTDTPAASEGTERLQ